ncbi:hypothetical protein AB0N14_13495 [Streptomyces sp. NPDC051104]|uniref:hypothetical protein n=1 Tax=Streptomyces sp. NPDC051104 TaxID=3155044 RepID=UPI003434918C
MSDLCRSRRDWRLPAHVAEELEVAQARASQRLTDVVDARAALASAEAELGDALSDLNRVINFILARDQ